LVGGGKNKEANRLFNLEVGMEHGIGVTGAKRSSYPSMIVKIHTK
jgi:hypothetical protein